MSNSPVELQTDRLRLFLPQPDDAACLLQFRTQNRAFFKPWLPTQQELDFTLDGVREQLEYDWQSFMQGKCLRFLVSTQEKPGEVIADLRFSNIVRGAFQSCYLGYLQAESACGKGYMTEALQKAVDYMFRIEGLHRVEANIMPRNEASLALVRRLGFREEGFSPDYLRINGKWEDHLRFAILNPA